MIELPKDLREMSEEQFVEVFNLLKEKTKNWTNFNEIMLLENNQFLLLIRCSLGLSQKEFGEKLNTNKQWVKELESGRRRIIHIKPAKRWTPLIEELIKDNKPSLAIGIAKWKEFKRVRHDISKPIKKNNPLVNI